MEHQVPPPHKRKKALLVFPDGAVLETTVGSRLEKKEAEQEKHGR